MSCAGRVRHFRWLCFAAVGLAPPCKACHGATCRAVVSACSSRQLGRRYCSGFYAAVPTGQFGNAAYTYGYDNWNRSFCGVQRRTDRLPIHLVLRRVDC